MQTRLRSFRFVTALCFGAFVHSGRADDRDVAIAVRRGNELLDKKEWDKAIKEFDSALKLDPKSFKALAGRASARAWKGDLESSLSDYDAAILINPKSTFLLVARGRVRGMKSDLDKAIEDFDAAIRIDPNHAPAFFNRGLARTHRKEWDKALLDLNEFIRLDPNPVLGYYERGRVRAAKGEWHRAIADYDEVLQLEPKNVLALGQRAFAFIEAGQWDRASRDIDAAIQIDPKDFCALSLRALIRAAHPVATMRDGRKAVADAKLACELSEWKNPACLAILAAASAEAGDFDEAVRWQKKALEDKDFARASRVSSKNALELYEKRKSLRGKPK
jgi:tetratricopeptide (TPR) repeat protein